VIAAVTPVSQPSCRGPPVLQKLRKVVNIHHLGEARILDRCIQTGSNMHFLWTILIGFVAGVIAKWIHPGSNEPSGFILTTILGIVGAFVATYLGQAVGWYKVDQSAGFIGAIVGAVIILTIWSLIDRWRRAA